MRPAFAVRPLSTLLLAALMTIVLTLAPLSAAPARAQSTPDAATTVVTTATDFEVATAAGHGTVPGPSLDGLPRVRWQLPGDPTRPGGGLIRPVIAGGLVWQQTDRLRAYDLATGEPRHEIETDWPLTSPTADIAVAGDLLLVPMPAGTPLTNADRTALDGSDLFDSGRLAGINAATGEIHWVAPVPRFIATPAVIGDTAWLTNDGQTLLALDTGTGQVRWVVTVQIPGGALLAPVVADGTVFVSTTTGFVGAYDAGTGAGRWVSSAGGEPGVRPLGQHARYDASAPIVIDGQVIVARVGEGYPIEPSLEALDADTGAATWSLRTETVVSGRMAAAADGALLVPFDSGLQAIDPATGTVLWANRASPGFVDQDQPVVAGDTIYLGQWYGAVNAIDARDGSWLWYGQTRTTFAGTPYVADGAAVFADWEGGGLTVLEGGGVAVDERSVPEPTAGNAPLPIVDISGLPACEPAARQPNGTPEAGPPVAALSDDRPTGSFGDEAPAIALDDLPAGTPADAATVASLRDLALRLESCGRQSPLLESPLQGDLYVTPGPYATYFTDDFGRRPWAAVTLIQFHGISYLPSLVPPPVLGDDIRVLPDGRVAAVASNSLFSANGVVYLFVEQDGQWLIDEYLRIDPTA